MTLGRIEEVLQVKWLKWQCAFESLSRVRETRWKARGRKNAVRRYLSFLLVSKDLDVSPYARVDNALRIGIEASRVNGNPSFGPIYHFRREYFDHIPAQDTENLILGSSICMIRSCAA
jgi:hypothetical protein